MKNKEKYAKEIIEIAISGQRLTVNNKYLPCKCCDINCIECLFATKNLRCKRDDNIEEWANEEYQEPILNDAEKKYLSAVIKPFRNDVRIIEKCTVKPTSINKSYNKSYIFIGLIATNMVFPVFNTNAMYTGMQHNRQYTLEELGL